MTKTSPFLKEKRLPNKNLKEIKARVFFLSTKDSYNGSFVTNKGANFDNNIALPFYNENGLLLKDEPPQKRKISSPILTFTFSDK